MTGGGLSTSFDCTSSYSFFVFQNEFPGSIQITNELHSNGEKTGNPEPLQNTGMNPPQEAV